MSRKGTVIEHQTLAEPGIKVSARQTLKKPGIIPPPFRILCSTMGNHRIGTFSAFNR